MSTHTTPKPTETGLLRGRFAEATDAFVEAFTASVDFDQRLYAEDIAGSIAHATMLGRIGILEDAEVTAIVTGLQAIQQEIESGQFSWQVALEDVHMNIESRLIELIGDTGKKLHTGRSRNDQVATDIRLYLRSAIDVLVARETELLAAIIDLAAANTHTVMPGFTDVGIFRCLVCRQHDGSAHQGEQLGAVHDSVVGFQHIYENFGKRRMAATAVVGNGLEPAGCKHHPGFLCRHPTHVTGIIASSLEATH